MNILNVNTVIDPLRGGGVAERTIQMSRFLAKKGMKCTILTLNLGITDNLVRSLSGVSLVAMPYVGNRFFVPVCGTRQLRQIVEEADIVHLMSNWAILNALVYGVARRLQKPYVVCPAGALPLHGKSIVIKRIYNALVGKKIVRNAAKCIAVTRDEISHFQSYGVDSEDVVVIPNGIDRDQYLQKDDTAIRRKLGLVAKPFILFVGRLNQIKGPDLLVRAFTSLKNDLPDYHLVLAGRDEGLLSLIEKIAAEQDMADRVHFVGFLRGAEKSQLYHAADLLVIPSRQEAMSIVVLEGGIVGCPVLVTDQCGVDFVAEICGGKIVPATVEGLRAGLLTLLGKPDMLPVMGENLRQYVEQRFDWDSVVQEYIRLYQGILAGRHGGRRRFVSDWRKNV